MITTNKDKFFIFLIEDRDEDIDITREALEQAEKGYSLEVAKEGKEALKLLRKKTKNEDEPLPDIILLDLNLPKMDGQQVLEELKDDEKLAAVPVIVLTVSKRDRDIARSYDSGAAGYIAKPIDFSEFVKTVNVINRYWSICEMPKNN